MRFSTPSGIEGRTILIGAGRSTAPEGGVSTPGVCVGGVSAVGSGASTRPRPRFPDGWLGSCWLGVEFGGAVCGAPPVTTAGCVGCVCRGSRPRKIRDRLKSSSSVTPGALVAAPVGRSITSGRRRPRTPDASPSGDGTFPISVAGRRGMLSITGSESTTRRAIGSSATGRPSEPLPKSRRGTRVTPRQFL